MSSHQSFRRAVQKSGGALDPKTEPAGFDVLGQRALAVLRQICEAINGRSDILWPLGNIQIELVKNLTFNAFAHEDSGEEAIAVFSGLFYSLFDLSFLLWANPAYLCRTHPIDAPPIDPQLVSERVASSWNELGWVKPMYITPKVPDRAQRAFNTALTAYIFICMHEVGHLVRSHIPHLRSQANLDTNHLLEFGNTLSLQGFEILQLLETDADIYAARAVADCALTTWNMGRIFPINHDIVRGTVMEYITEIAIGLSLAFFCMDMTTGSRSLKTNSTHPSPGVRLFVSHLAAMQLLDKPFGISMEASLEAMILGFVEVKDFWTAIGLPIWSIDNDPVDIAQVANQMYARRCDYQAHLHDVMDARLRKHGTSLAHYNEFKSFYE